MTQLDICLEIILFPSWLSLLYRVAVSFLRPHSLYRRTESESLFNRIKLCIATVAIEAEGNWMSIEHAAVNTHVTLCYRMVPGINVLYISPRQVYSSGINMHRSWKYDTIATRSSFTPSALRSNDIFRFECNLCAIHLSGLLGFMTNIAFFVFGWIFHGNHKCQSIDPKLVG